MQGLAEANLGYRFSPGQIRSLLSDPANGTPPAVTEATQIGVMPDLRAILDGNDINLAHDVYLRDNVGDTGDPHAGSISASPDIILLPATVADPQASFGEGSGTENDNSLGFEATAGQDNFLYARLRNRGGSNATNVEATIFWSPVATLVTPDLWTLVGSTSLPSVPMGDLLTVSSAITWLQAEIPGPGHYCFVGLVGTPQDPAPAPADFFNFDNFRTFIRENNNVTWRNFNVVPSTPPGPDPNAPVAVEFLAPGAPDKGRRMSLEVCARLPKGSRAWLEMPLYLIDALQLRSPFLKLRKRQQTALVPISPHGSRSFGDVLFAAKSRAKLRLHVQIPTGERHNAYEVFVRQLYREQEVGRATWRFAPKRRPPKYE